MQEPCIREFAGLGDRRSRRPVRRARGGPRQWRHTRAATPVAGSSCFAIGAGVSDAAARIAARGGGKCSGPVKNRNPDVLVARADANLPRRRPCVKRVDKVRAPQE